MHSRWAGRLLHHCVASSYLPLNSPLLFSVSRSCSSHIWQESKKQTCSPEQLRNPSSPSSLFPVFTAVQLHRAADECSSAPLGTTSFSGVGAAASLFWAQQDHGEGKEGVLNVHAPACTTSYTFYFSLFDLFVCIFTCEAKVAGGETYSRKGGGGKVGRQKKRWRWRWKQWRRLSWS